MYDFHMHSKYSDGVYDIDKILEKIQLNNIKYFSLTDHDTIEGSKQILEQYKDFLKKNNIEFIIGAELSTSINGYKTHLLAYDFDYKDENINKLLKILKTNKWNESLYRIKKLNELFGISLSNESIEYLKNRDSVTKPNIAECMKKEGIVDSIGEGIKKYINKIPKENFYLDSEIAVKLVHAANGKVFLAHPFGESSDEIFDKSNVEPYIKSLVNSGIDGMECYYSAYDNDRITFLLKLAQKYNLLVSAGSDCHGRPNKYGNIGQTSSDNTKVNQNSLTILSLFKK